MSTRRGWLFRWGGVAIVWTVAAVAFGLAQEWAACFVAGGAALAWLFNTRAAVWLWRSGFHTGRGSEIVDQARRRRGYATTPPGLTPNPWDPFPEWPDEP